VQPVVRLGVEAKHFGGGLHAGNDAHVTRQVQRGKPGGYTGRLQCVDATPDADQFAGSNGAFQ
jgi:hypothetical protein